MGTGGSERSVGRYWVIGGKRLEGADSPWAWSELLGPYPAWELAALMRTRMADLYRHDPQVQFSVAKDADHAS
jgi:hypothetical protein